jgi:small-conductance mechanosensitive channel
MLKRLCLIIVFSFSLLHAQSVNVDLLAKNIKIENLKERIENINFELKNNIWLIRYENFLTYQKLGEELNEVKKQVQKYKRRRDKASQKLYDEYLIREENLQKQIELLKEFQTSPFLKIVKPDELAQRPSVSNPLAIISAFSYIKQIEKERMNYDNKIKSLDELISSLKEKESLMKELVDLNVSDESVDSLENIEKDISAFNSAHTLAETTFSLYSKKVDEAKLNVTADIKAQMQRAFNIGMFVLVVIVLSLVFKLIVKKYIKDNERFYMANKIINFINISLIVIILLFAYIENVSYFVTVLGFASAGIAIAMKDWFMSILGWLVIVFGGSFHVGDRIKVQKDGLPWVGDIIDISLLRMTILEDITLTSYMQNRRSGRVVFIPNNYIFTTLISNYTHGTLKTVWDGIDFTITFDSNHKKAIYIIKEITKRYSRGYTDIARRSLNQLRNQYSLKNTNVEPRIYSFLEPYGIVISTWYMTNSYAALTLRSTISAEIIDAIKNEDDIKVAYPTQTINLNHRTDKDLQDFDINKGILY